MFDSGIKQGVTFISIAFFYTLSLNFFRSCFPLFAFIPALRNEDIGYKCKAFTEHLLKIDV